MKKLTAKICIWILGKLGYEKNYSIKNEHKIFINVDASEALERINEFTKTVQKLKAELNGLHTK